MKSPYQGTVVGAGTRIQAGIPSRVARPERSAAGLLLRGVVVATYVSDEGGHPQEGREGELDQPLAVYCDVLVYPSIPGQRLFALKHAVVAQDVAGVHRGRIWKPRAATIDTSGNSLDQTSNPALLDGDHVLVGFLNDNFDQPVILKSLPHPIMDAGHEIPEKELGKRMKLKVTDGDPDFFKHHGVYYGVSDIGSFIVDTTWANDGELAVDGSEAVPPVDGKGGQNFRLPQHASYDLVFYDMSNPAVPVEVMKLTVDKDKLHLKVTQGETLKVEEDGVDAKLTLGNGAVKVAVADHLETLHTAVKAWLEALTVPTGTGPSGTPINSPAPSWDPYINSSQALIPDTKP